MKPGDHLCRPTIEAFLTARYDEREAAARSASKPPWRGVPTGEGDCAMDGPAIYGQHTEGFVATADAEHITLNDPAYVLDDIAAKRKIVDRYVKAFDNVRKHPGDMASKGAALTMLGVVHILAAPFASHPDFDPTWKDRT